MHSLNRTDKNNLVGVGKTTKKHTKTTGKNVQWFASLGNEIRPRIRHKIQFG